MRFVLWTATAIALTATPLWAQENGGAGNWENAPGYVTALGGFATATGNTTGDLLVEGAVRVAPHVMVFGDVGQFHNLTGVINAARKQKIQRRVGRDQRVQVMIRAVTSWLDQYLGPMK